MTKREAEEFPATPEDSEAEGRSSPEKKLVRTRFSRESRKPTPATFPHRFASASTIGQATNVNSELRTGPGVAGEPDSRRAPATLCFASKPRPEISQTSLRAAQSFECRAGLWRLLHPREDRCRSTKALAERPRRLFVASADRSPNPKMNDKLPGRRC